MQNYVTVIHDAHTEIGRVCTYQICYKNQLFTGTRFDLPQEVVDFVDEITGMGRLGKDYDLVMDLDQRITLALQAAKMDKALISKDFGAFQQDRIRAERKKAEENQRSATILQKSHYQDPYKRLPNHSCVAPMHSASDYSRLCGEPTTPAKRAKTRAYCATCGRGYMTQGAKTADIQAMLCCKLRQEILVQYNPDCDRTITVVSIPGTWLIQSHKGRILDEYGVTQYVRETTVNDRIIWTKPNYANDKKTEEQAKALKRLEKPKTKVTRITTPL